MIYLKSNHGGRYQPHQCARGADLVITDCGAATASQVVQLANVTTIAIPFAKTLPSVPFADLGPGKFVNLYKSA